MSPFHVRMPFGWLYRLGVLTQLDKTGINRLHRNGPVSTSIVGDVGLQQICLIGFFDFTLTGLLDAHRSGEGIEFVVIVSAIAAIWMFLYLLIVGVRTVKPDSRIPAAS